jgi:hypothetical protein
MPASIMAFLIRKAVPFLKGTLIGHEHSQQLKGFLGLKFNKLFCDHNLSDSGMDC